MLPLINGRVADLLPHQEAFLRMFEPDGPRYPALFGGYGCGKSHVGAILALGSTMRNKGCTTLYTCLDYPTLRDAILPEFERVLAAYELREGADYTLDARLVFTNLRERDEKGECSKILFRPVDTERNLRKLVAITAGAAILDEGALYDERVIRKISERVRDKRAVVPFVATVSTPEGLTHCYDLYVKNPRERVAAGFDGQEQYVYVKGRTRDNPNLDEGYIESLYELYDAQLVKAYLEGEFVALIDRQVFSMFSEDLHVTDDAEYSKFLPISMAWDFNVDPMSVTLNHQKGDEFWTFDEIVLRNSGTQQACQEFLARYGDHTSGVWIYGDAAGRSRSTKAHWSDYDIITDQLRGVMPGFQEKVPQSNPTQRDSINKVNALLLNGNGKTGYYIHPRCGETIKSLQATVWDDLGTGIRKKPGDYEHLSDGLRYWIDAERPDIRRILARGREKTKPGRATSAVA